MARHLHLCTGEALLDVCQVRRLCTRELQLENTGTSQFQKEISIAAAARSWLPDAHLDLHVGPIRSTLTERAEDRGLIRVSVVET